MMNQTFKQIDSVVTSSKSIGIVSHINPDGDNLGSCTAMIDTLRSLGKNVYFIENDTIPNDLLFLKYTNDRVSLDLLSQRLDLIICLDSSDPNRLGSRSKEILSLAPNLINIDHHKSNTKYGDINYVDSSATSTGELVYKLIKALGWNLSSDAATSLYTAITTDTGSFQYDSVNAQTHLIASDLITLGANTVLVNKMVFQSKSLAKTLLLVNTVKNIQFFQSNKVAVINVSLKDLKDASAESSDTEGIIEFVRNIEGVELAILLKEKDSSLVKLSLRSKEKLDCTLLAEKFDGGGHARASGATIHLPLNQATDKVVEAMKEVYF